MRENICLPKSPQHMVFVLFHSFIATLTPLVSRFWLSLFTIAGLMMVFITHQPAQKGK